MHEHVGPVVYYVRHIPTRTHSAADKDREPSSVGALCC
jgi:hypothetical protein